MSTYATATSKLVFSEVDKLMRPKICNDKIKPFEDYLDSIYGKILNKDVLSIVHSYTIPSIEYGEEHLDQTIRMFPKYDDPDYYNQKYSHVDALYRYSEEIQQTIDGELAIHRLVMSRDDNYGTRLKLFKKAKGDTKKDGKEEKTPSDTQWVYFSLTEDYRINRRCDFLLMANTIDYHENDLIFTKICYNGMKEVITIPYRGVGKFCGLDFVYNSTHIAFRLWNETKHSMIYFYDTVSQKYINYLNLDDVVELYFYDCLYEDISKYYQHNEIDSFIIFTHDYVMRYSFEGNIISYVHIGPFIKEHLNPYYIKRYSVNFKGGVFKIDNCYFVGRFKGKNLAFKLIGF